MKIIQENILPEEIETLLKGGIIEFINDGEVIVKISGKDLITK